MRATNSDGAPVFPLKEWRLRRYWSFRQLAEEAKVSIKTIQRAEQGKKTFETTQRKIADALGISVSQIAEFRTPEPES